MQAITLKNYIDKYYSGMQRAFANANNIAPPQVTQWLNKDFIVVDNKLYSARRVLTAEKASRQTQP